MLKRLLILSLTIFSSSAIQASEDEANLVSTITVFAEDKEEPMCNKPGQDPTPGVLAYVEKEDNSFNESDEGNKNSPASLLFSLLSEDQVKEESQLCCGKCK